MMRNLALMCAVVGATAEAVELDSSNWDKLVGSSGKSAFVKFLAPW
jgi:hypothetical protein